MQNPFFLVVSGPVTCSDLNTLSLWKLGRWSYLLWPNVLVKALVYNNVLKLSARYLKRDLIEQKTILHLNVVGSTKSLENFRLVGWVSGGASINSVISWVHLTGTKLHPKCRIKYLCNHTGFYKTVSVSASLYDWFVANTVIVCKNWTV
jgi:hypothetical protein